MNGSRLHAIGGGALVVALISTLFVSGVGASGATTVRQQRAAYVKKIYALPLPDFLTERRHWYPIQKAKGTPAASHRTDWSSDGCSGGPIAWGLIDGEFAGEPWERVFNNACIRHDFGYRNFGKGRLDGLAYASTPAQRKAVDSQLFWEAEGRCSTFTGEVNQHCLEAAAAMYAAVRIGGADAFYGRGCYSHDLCLHATASDRSISRNTPNLGTQWEFNDKASTATNGSAVAWKVFNDADYHGGWKYVPPGRTVTLPTTSGYIPFSQKPAASSVLKMLGATC